MSVLAGLGLVWVLGVTLVVGAAAMRSSQLTREEEAQGPQP